MSVRAIEVTIKGTTSLLMHRYPLMPIEALEKKTPQEQAEIAAYRDETTQELYVPGVAIQRALVRAASYSKGKGRASLQKQAAACLMIRQERITLKTKTYQIDSRAVVVPATKGRIVRHRPRIDNWQISFTLEFDNTLLKESEVRRICDDACSRVGFLDFRPEKNGPFGRGMVVNWNVA